MFFLLLLIIIPFLLISSGWRPFSKIDWDSRKPYWDGKTWRKQTPNSPIGEDMGQGDAQHRIMWQGKLHEPIKPWWLR